jgi:hypothetical protein
MAVLWPIQFSPAGFRSQTTPLFEEKRNLLRDTLITYLAHPLRAHFASRRSALSTDDHPSDAGKFQFSNGRY